MRALSLFSFTIVFIVISKRSTLPCSSSTYFANSHHPHPFLRLQSLDRMDVTFKRLSDDACFISNHEIKKYGSIL